MAGETPVGTKRLKNEIILELSANSDVPYFATLAEAVQQVAVNRYFKTDSSDGTGPHPNKLWFYKRTLGAPFYEVMLSGAVPAAQSDLESMATQFDTLIADVNEQVDGLDETVDAISVAPEKYGAKGDGVTDDSVAIQAAFNSGKNVRLSAGKTYVVKKRLSISAGNVTVSGGGRFKIVPGWNFALDTDGPPNFYTHLRMIFVTGAFVRFTGITFECEGYTFNEAGTGVENGFIWSTAPYTAVDNCTFIGFPKGTCVWGLSAWTHFQGNTVYNCEAAVFVRGRNAIIADNIITNAKDAAIALNGLTCIGATVTGNTINNELLRPIPSMIAVEESASDWVIANNVMQGVNGSAVWCGNVLLKNNVPGGVVKGNIITAESGYGGTRPTTTNFAALIYISEHYENWIVQGNYLRGVPTGNSSSCAVLLPISGGLFADNVIDGRTAPDIAGLIQINTPYDADNLPVRTGLTIRNNKTIMSNGRHFVFSPGDYAGQRVAFVGGEFVGGAVAIDTTLNAGGITGLTDLYIENIEYCSAATVANAANILGDRAGFLNLGAIGWPHKVGARTVMYANGVPTDAGVMPYLPGDTFYYMDPSAPYAASSPGIIRVPGQFRSMAALQ